MKKQEPLPTFASDEEAKALVEAAADLPECDFSDRKRTRFDIVARDETLAAMKEAREGDLPRASNVKALMKELNMDE